MEEVRLVVPTVARLHAFSLGRASASEFAAFKTLGELDCLRMVSPLSTTAWPFVHVKTQAGEANKARFSYTVPAESEELFPGIMEHFFALCRYAGKS